MALDERKICNGTFGEVWLDDNYVTECYGLQAKLNFSKEDVKKCGSMGTGKKVTGYNGTGSLKLHKTTSRMINAIADDIRSGKDVRFTIITKLADPDADGTERITLYDVSFDDLTLADWEAATLGKTECPFTFTDYEVMDKIS